MCEIYTETKLTEPYLLACSTEIVSAQLPQKVRENAFAEHLTEGYFRTLLSTTPQYRLGRALRKVGSPSNSLLQELPIASLIAWAERGDEEFVLGRVKDRIANSIIAQASKAVVRPEKLQGTAAGAAPIEALSERYPGVGHR